MKVIDERETTYDKAVPFESLVNGAVFKYDGVIMIRVLTHGYGDYFWNAVTKSGAPFFIKDYELVEPLNAVLIIKGDKDE